MEIDLTLLINSTRQGDSAAFSRLYGFYADDMFRYALYILGNKEDAEDAVQETAISAWRGINSLRDDTLFKAWLFKILKNRCMKTSKSKGKNPELLSEDFSEFTLKNEADELCFKSCELREALKNLTPPDGQIILLSIIGGFTSSELARIYQMPPATVRSRQKRALEKLRLSLKGEF